MQQIKEEAIKEYNDLDEAQKQDNSVLLKINEKFDIIENINYNILNNDLIQISKSINNFIEDYNKYRYTLPTDKRINLLNKYLEAIKNLDNIKIDNEKKDPKIILKEILLDLNRLKIKCKNLKPQQFVEEYQKILDEYKYDLKEIMFSPANFGNMNFKYSLLLSDFLKTFGETFNNNQGDFDNIKSNIKRKFEKNIDVIRLFLTTIKNSDNILDNKLYYEYLTIIYMI